MSSLFVGSNISSFYRFARPRYPSSTISGIFNAWNQLMSSTETPECVSKMRTSGIAVDVACGSGQLTELLSHHFSMVIASDISATQISAAKEEFSNSPHMEFHIGDCYSLKCPDSGADLITVAQALHWFDVPRFYAEVTRCLKPTGALALICYGFCRLRCPDNPNEELVNQMLNEYFIGDKYIGPYWDSRRALVDSKYVTLPMFNENKCIRLSDEMHLNLSLSQFVNYMKSQSAYHTYLEAVKPSQEADVLNVFISQLAPLLSNNGTAAKSNSSAGSGGGDETATAEPILPLVCDLTTIVCVK